MKNTVLELRGRFWACEQEIEKCVKKASKANTMQTALIAEVRIVKLENSRRAISKLLTLAEDESEQMEKEHKRKPYTGRN